MGLRTLTLRRLQFIQPVLDFRCARRGLNVCSLEPDAVTRGSFARFSCSELPIPWNLGRTLNAEK